MKLKWTTRLAIVGAVLTIAILAIGAWAQRRAPHSSHDSTSDGSRSETP